MLEADALEWLVRKSREIKATPTPPKRRQPKVARLESPDQRRVGRQTRDPIRAIYGTESQYNRTPEARDGVELTRNVGPSDLPKNDPGIGAKPTQSRTGVGRFDRPEQRRQQRSGQPQKRRTKEDWSALADQYEI